MTDSRPPVDDDAPEATATGEGRDGASPDVPTGGVVISRRKLMYASPMVVSERLIHALAGCGKGDPRQGPCQINPMGGS